MEFSFSILSFLIDKGRCFISSNNKRFEKDETGAFLPLSEIQLAGGARPSVNQNLCIGTSEAASLRYVSHELSCDHLYIVERNERIEVVSSFFSYSDLFFSCTKFINWVENCFSIFCNRYLCNL